jgi:pyruvate/oxaloacetate carboxyltransferase
MELERIIKPATYFGAAFGGGAASTITLGFVSDRFFKKAKELREQIINKTKLVPLKKGQNTTESFRERAEAKLDDDIEIVKNEIGWNDDFDDDEPWEVENDGRSKK